MSAAFGLLDKLHASQNDAPATLSDENRHRLHVQDLFIRCSSTAIEPKGT